MTKEEFKRDLIRMWDSVRTENKGEGNCGGVRCLDCPLYMKAQCGPVNSFEYIDLVENWAKQNPIMTNADKFKEVFGVEYDPINACIKHNIKCGNCQYYNYDGTCDVTNRFWNAEYKPTKESEE